MTQFNAREPNDFADDRRIVIREAEPKDAAELLDYMQRLFAEPGINLITEPDEFSLTLQGEIKFLTDMTATTNSLYLLAEHNGMIIGQLTLAGGKKRAIRHSATLGITVAKEWRGQGVGRQLMEAAITYARQSGIIKRIELQVLARNEPAIHLYQQLGFEIEGTRRQAVFRDGEFRDDYIMALIL
jgi:RimJ/RimL family protein N-acetyltransferase